MQWLFLGQKKLVFKLGTQTNLDPSHKPNAKVCRPFLLLIIMSHPNYHTNLNTAASKMF